MGTRAGSGGGFPGSYDYGLGYLLFTETLASDFSFFAKLLQAVLAGNSSDGGDQGDPSVISLHFVEAEEQAAMETGLDGADVAANLFAGLESGAVSGGEGLGQAGVKMVASFNFVGVDSIGELDEEDCALGYDVGWR